MKQKINESFNVQLESCLNIAKWSPSSHNSQPWFCLLVENSKHQKQLFKNINDQLLLEDPGSRVILLGLDNNRCLKALAAHDLEMHLSLGAFSQVLIRLLYLSGYSILVNEYYEQSLALDWIDKSKEPKLAVIIKVDNHNQANIKKPEQKTCYDRFVDLVKSRKTNRGGYLPISSSDQFFNEESVLQYAKLYDQHDSQVVHFNNTWQVQTIVELIKKHAGLDFQHNQAWSETYRYIYFLTKDCKPIGFSVQSLFGDCNFIKRLWFATIFNPKVISMLNYFGFHQLIAKQMATLVNDCAFCVGITIEHSASIKQKIMAGAKVVDNWLSATANGLSYHPLSILLQHDHVRSQLERRLGVKGRLIFFVRVGQAISTFKDTSRISGDELLTTDLF
ncbi:nitroreductase family protein [Spartinivicinus poritis]|uniref:Nitroreductase family protein n=1 Tax=Spartinivicinus poritis TaxID=2994640 RepID=A0ABT5U587_9GAMM|nr:nitroreductase family protein [Spartinivicinus sp. A2-2]MDE1461513.1 nitroreductase family protein [Spartinivicinus sp. A2-2]